MTFDEAWEEITKEAQFAGYGREFRMVAEAFWKVCRADSAQICQKRSIDHFYDSGEPIACAEAIRRAG